jgi:hypothetical protein
MKTQPSLIPYKLNDNDMRQMYSDMENLRGRLLTDRAPYEPLWYAVRDCLDPQFTIWDPSMSGFPSFIIDILKFSPPFQAFDDLMTNLQSGITPASQEWHQIEPQDEDLRDDEEVMEFCQKVNSLYKQVFQKSNFYQTTPMLYRSFSRFLTGAIMSEEDFDTHCRFTCFPIGSFYISNNNKGVVDTFVYEFRWKLRQIVEEFCTDEEGNVDVSLLDETLQSQWKSETQKELPKNMVLVIKPNPDHNPSEAKYNPAKKKYLCVYYIRDAGNKKILELRGFDKFPIWVVRWFRQPTDAYGVDGPGFKAVGDTNQVYEEVKLKLTALQKVIEPPMTGPASLAGYPRGTTPGFFTMLPEGQKNDGFKPAYQIQPDLKAIREDIQELIQNIKKTCLSDLFRMFTDDQKLQPRTATEVLQKIQEMYNILGPVYGALEYEWLQPMFDWMWDLFVRQGVMPPIPKQLQGKVLKVTFVSRVAMALKLAETTSYEKVWAQVQAVFQRNPNISDVINDDEMLRSYGVLSNLSPKFFNAEDKVQKIRQTRAQQQKQQQTAERLPAVAGAAKDLNSAGLLPQGQGQPQQ